jgi:hypothetical protein
MQGVELGFRAAPWQFVKRLSCFCCQGNLTQRRRVRGGARRKRGAEMERGAEN